MKYNGLGVVSSDGCTQKILKILGERITLDNVSLYPDPSLIDDESYDGKYYLVGGPLRVGKLSFGGHDNYFEVTREQWEYYVRGLSEEGTGFFISGEGELEFRLRDSTGERMYIGDGN